MKTFVFRSVYLHSSGAASSSYSSYSKTVFRHSPFILFHSSSLCSCTSCSSSSHPSTRWCHKKGSEKYKVSVWWDFDSCSIPVGVNILSVTQRITLALRAYGMKSPVTINSFGDVLQLSRVNQEALASTGINHTHIPNISGKSNAYSFLAVDLFSWVFQNPSPAHVFIISGDSGLTST